MGRTFWDSDMGGFKYFTPTQLTANDVNEYLMNQSVMVFASAAVRANQLTAPTEGMVTYLQDVDRLEVYDGTTWERVLVLDSANRFFLPASAIFTTESATGRGVGVTAGTGDAYPATVQFTNAAVSAEWAKIQAPSAGVLNLDTARVQRAGNNFVNIIDLSTILIDEFTFAGTNPRNYSPTIPSNARYLFLDAFITANSSDHQNLELSNASTGTAIKNWVDTRGSQPSTQFGSMTARRSVYLTYNGEVDGYSPNYGMWYSGILAPCSGPNLYWSLYGNSGSSGWVYLKIMGYST
jgi:hypothetical protein